MKASNLYPEIAKAFYPDLSIGTVALWIERPHSAAPITVSAIPLRELEINLGPYGEIDDRFAVRYTRNSYVRELVGEEIWGKIDQKIRDKMEAKPTVRTQVVWGFWRRWEDKSDEVWQHVVLVGDELVHDTIIKGEWLVPALGGAVQPDRGLAARHRPADPGPAVAAADRRTRIHADRKRRARAGAADHLSVGQLYEHRAGP